MSLSHTTRSRGNAPGLLAAMVRPEALSRRNALGAAAAVALSLATLSGTSAIAQAEPAAIMAPASPDADLIALANRLVALTHRWRATADRRSTVEDRVVLSCPRPDSLPKPASGYSLTENTTAAATIYTIERPHERDPAWIRWEEATAAAQAAHEEQERAAGARLGLPELERRYDRMLRRCDRWAARLGAMRPETAEGLTAKATAVLALVGDDRFSREIELSHHADLVMSLVADVVRLGTGGQA